MEVRIIPDLGYRVSEQESGRDFVPHLLQSWPDTLWII